MVETSLTETKGAEPRAFEFRSFTVGNVELSAKYWPKSGGLPVIASHGWMDNCASFDDMAPHLSHCDLLCLDLAGHGKSGHRGHLGAYNIWQDMAEVLQLAKLMNWPQFALLGHSRGAMVSFLLASTFPEKITHLALIEGMFPFTEPDHKAPIVLKNAIEGVFKAEARPIHYYETFEAAVSSRVNGLIPLERRDASTLAAHGVLESEKGFNWNYDHKLVAGSEVRFSEEQVKAFARNIYIPVFLAIGDSGLIAGDHRTNQLMSLVSGLKVHSFAGGHHLHMHQQAAAIAERMTEYLNER